MDYDKIEALRKDHPAWRLLASNNAALVPTFLQRVFVNASDGTKRETRNPMTVYLGFSRETFRNPLRCSPGYSRSKTIRDGSEKPTGLSMAIEVTKALGLKIHFEPAA